MDPDQTRSSLIWVHTVCKKSLLKSQADDKAIVVIGSLKVNLLSAEFVKVNVTCNTFHAAQPNIE